MKNNIRLITAALVVLLLLLFAGSALAANLEVTFTWTVDGHDFSVLLDKKEAGKYVLYMPGAFRGQDPVLSINQNTEMIMDGVNYQSGMTVPISQYAGQTVQVSFTGGKGKMSISVMQGSAIPALFINVSANDLKRISKRRDVDIEDPADMRMVTGDGRLNAAETLTSFKTRGNSTFFAQKKPFSFKMENKADLAGMGQNKKWILLANWNDVSLLRNQITYDLYIHLGMKYSPECRQVDLYLNHKYHGIYLLSEKIQLKKNRLEISDLEEEYEKLNGKEAYENAKIKFVRYKKMNIRWYDHEEEPEDITGGYLLELELAEYYARDKTLSGIKTDFNMYVTIKEPSHIGQRGAEYIADLMNGLNYAAIDPSGYNSEGKYYADYLDVHSFALKAAIDEFIMNLDVRATSQFLYKEKDSIDPLLHAGLAWDFDWSYGNHSEGFKDPKMLDFVYRRSSFYWFLTHWLLTHEDFQQQTRKAYEEEVFPAAEILLGRKEAPEGSALRSLDEYKAAIADSAAMNYSRWKSNGNPELYKGSGTNFDDSCTYLKNWIDTRADILLESWQPGNGGK